MKERQRFEGSFIPNKIDEYEEIYDDEDYDKYDN